MTEISERGNEIYRDWDADRKLGIRRGAERYYYDFEALKGWKQFDTSQDAWYFGVWVDVKGMRIFTYAEGDRTLVVCKDRESFKAELKSMAEFYGDPPPAWIAYDLDAKTRTEYFDARPTGEEV